MEPTLSTLPPTPTTPQARRRWRRRLAFTGIVVVLLGTLFWSGWYVYNRGFTRKWRDLLTAELRRRGFGFTARRLTLNPFEGLVAEEAHLYLLDEQHTQVLALDRVQVDISLRNFIQKKPFLNSLDLRGASLTLPVDMADPNGPKLELRHFQAKLSILPDEVRLTQAQGDFYGLQLSASGTLQHPGSFSPGGAPADPEQRARRREWAHFITSEIKKVRSRRAPPQLEILFQGDLTHLESLRASAQLSGQALRRGSYALEKLLVRLDYAAGAFHLRQGEFTDAHGTLSALGDYTPGTGEARFQAQSGLDSRQRGLDLVALAHEFYSPTALNEFQFHEPPRLQVDGRAHFAAATGAELPAAPASAASLQLTGRLALGPFSYGKFEFERGETDFSWSGDRWYLRDLRLVRPGNGNGFQQIAADVLSEPAGCRVRLTSTFDPMAFVSLAPTRLQAAVERLEFRDPPRVELTATGKTLGDPASLRVQGQFTLGRTRYRGQGINRLHGEFTSADHLLTARKVLLERDEGNATGELVAYDLDKHEIRLTSVHTNLDPATAGVWLDPDVYHAILPYKFRKPPALAIHGNVQFEGQRNSHLVTEVSAPGGMDFVFVKKTLPFGAVTGQVLFNEERMQFKDLNAELFGGQVQGNVDLALGRVKDYTASLDVKGLDFAKLTKLYFDYDDSKGLLAGSYRWTGRGDDPRTLHGMGSINVDRGDVFSIPFLGPLSSLLSNVLPGLGFDKAHHATATFLTDSGKIYTDNLDVKGLGFSLFGGGWLGYTENAMNFRVRMNTRGLPGVVLYPVSKLFEYSSQGPLDKPVWRPSVLTSPVLGLERKPLPTPAPVAPTPVRGR